MVFETLALSAGLIMLIIILAVSILAVEKLKPKRKPLQANACEKSLRQKPLQTKLQIYYNKPLVREMQKPENLADLKMTERILQLQSAFTAVKARVEMAHSRLDSIESEVARTKKAVLEQARLLSVSPSLESEKNEISELKGLIESKTAKPFQSSFEKSIEKQKRLDDEYIKSIAFGRTRR